LEKALKYAIASNGKSFMGENTQEKLKEKFDIRGFFLNMDQQKIKEKLDLR